MGGRGQWVGGDSGWEGSVGRRGQWGGRGQWVGGVSGVQSGRVNQVYILLHQLSHYKIITSFITRPTT